VTHEGIDPTRSKPDIFSVFKDFSSPIDEGRFPEKPGASRPSLFKDWTLPMELGIVPEKLVSPRSKFCRQLLTEIFGRLPDIL
jgi:hypothetical protein